jgi:eukaryotic-like serine/threonine-protein kinase
VSTILSQLGDALSGRYSILREVGQGGMATVFLAEDVRHDRKVALKVLKPELAAVLGADRFVVEIKTTAALQHPHILPLFDSGEAGGFLYYVMPFVDGETLRAKLDRESQLGVSEAVRITVAVADALDYAHRHGVVHRDIKPENILLHEGRPVVADFGIALAVSAAAGGRMTETGLSLGTPHYMSPEQATAEKEITGRSDIYSIASVLYEMLTGNPPHTASTAQQIIMKIITETPQPVTAHRKSVPPHVAAAIAQGLEKLPADRFGSAREFAEALGNPAFTLATQAASAGPPRATGPRARAMAMAPWVMLVIVTGLLASVPFRDRPHPVPVTRFTIAFEGYGAVSDGFGSPIAVAPDGSRIVYVGRDSVGAGHLFSRTLDSDEPVLIAGTRDAHAPFISPDGRYLGFAQGGKLRRISFGGGGVTTIADAASNTTAWGPDGFVYMGLEDGLYRVEEAGGVPERVVPLDTTRFDAIRWPDILPGGRHALVTVVRRGEPRLAVASLRDGTIEELGKVGMYPRYVSAGYIVFVQQDANLFAVPFDVQRRRISGAQVLIAPDVRFGPAFPGKLGVSRTGTVAYLSGQATLRQVVIFDRDGGQTTVPGPGQFYQFPRFSPDGRRIAVLITDFTATAKSDLWTVDAGSGQLTRVTFDSASKVSGWSSDRRHLIYVSRESFLRIPVDGSGLAETLFTRPGRRLADLEISHDGRTIAWEEEETSGDRNIYVASDGWTDARPLLATPFRERTPALSQDGRFLAYTSNETGDTEVFVRRLTAGSGRWRITNGGAGSPRWGSRNELFYRHGDTISAVILEDGEEPRFSAPRRVLVTPMAWGTPAQYDVSPDGQRVVLVRSESLAEIVTMRVVMNWFEQLKAGARRSER